MLRRTQIKLPALDASGNLGMVTLEDTYNMDNQTFDATSPAAYDSQGSDWVRLMFLAEFSARNFLQVCCEGAYRSVGDTIGTGNGGTIDLGVPV